MTRETEFRFQVTTDEGDVVTITGSSEESRTYGSLRYRDRDEDGATRLTARFREIELDEEFSITVEGDLSEEELADIRKLVNEIRPALASGGKAGGIPIRALDASRFESLARFELFLEQSITRTLVHARLRRDGNGDVLPPPEPGMPAPPPAA